MRALVAVVLLLLSALPARAGDDPDFVLDPASRVRFQLQALGWWPVRGEARAEGSVTMRDDLAVIDVRVPLESLQMSREGYRNWALSAEFFSAKAHPELGFRADAMPLQHLREGGEISGDLQVRGRTRRARFTLVASSCTAAATRCRVQATGELSRRAFGMRTRRYTLSDRIRIDLDLQLVPVP